jgi:hypothetical protein
MQQVQRYFTTADIAEIQKIHPSTRNEDDFLAWFPDRRGLFSVRSAYKFGLQGIMQLQDQGTTSSSPSGERPYWKLIWRCPVPPKMKNLAWRIARNGLSTQLTLCTRGIAQTSICQICGEEEEDTFHAFIRCPHARDLWLAMREIWDIPSDDQIRATGSEWLLHLLDDLTLNKRARVLMILWRIWHSHNELTHGKPCPSIEGSRRFLVSYMHSLLQIKQFPDADDRKGKTVVDPNLGFKRNTHVEDGRQKTKKKWQAPDVGMAKLNTDGAFSSKGEAGSGMVLRDHKGDVIFAACRNIRSCREALEAEFMALEEGIKLGLCWMPMQFTIETDCLEAVELLKDGVPNASVYAFRINSICELLRERGSNIVKISRDSNRVSHELAKLGRVHHRTAVWLRNYPPEVKDAIAFDCNLTPT